MSRRTDELLALRDLALIVHAFLDGTRDVAALREAVSLCDVLRPRDYRPRAIGADGGERGGCVDSGLALPGNLGKDKIIKTSQNKREIGPNIFLNRGTWLSPFASAWVARFGKGSTVPWGRLASALRNIVSEQGADEVLRRWKNYLSSTTPEFVNPQRFAFTFGSWEKPQAPKVARGEVPYQEPSESIDAYIARLARLGF